MSLHFVWKSFVEWSGTRRGVGSYDAFHDPLEEDRLSFVVGVFHPGERTLLRGLCTGQVGPRQGGDQGETSDNLVGSI